MTPWGSVFPKPASSPTPATPSIPATPARDTLKWYLVAGGAVLAAIVILGGWVIPAHKAAVARQQAEEKAAKEAARAKLIAEAAAAGERIITEACRDRVLDQLRNPDDAPRFQWQPVSLRSVDPLEATVLGKVIASTDLGVRKGAAILCTVKGTHVTVVLFYQEPARTSPASSRPSTPGM
jgi:hypothetical protein